MGADVGWGRYVYSDGSPDRLSPITPLPIIPCQGIVLINQARYSNGKITDIEPKLGNWLLVVGPRAIGQTLLTLTARLAKARLVRVVDGGNPCINAHF
jgi:hypothetical protein